MAGRTCPTCGGPLVPVDSYVTEGTTYLRLPFPSPPIVKLFDELHAVYICPEPGCADFTRQRTF